MPVEEVERDTENAADEQPSPSFAYSTTEVRELAARARNRAIIKTVFLLIYVAGALSAFHIFHTLVGAAVDEFTELLSGEDE